MGSCTAVQVKVMVEDLAARLPDPASGPLPDDMPEAARAHMAKLKTQVNSLTRQLKASEAQNTSLQKKLDNVIGERDASRVRLQTLEESGAAAALMDLDVRFAQGKGDLWGCTRACRH